jgi:acyl-CoA reductase-like NAD-dependent aldehyde dehydrogenase
MDDQRLMYIGGEWRESAGGWFGVEDPSTGERFAEVPATTPADVDDAVAAAKNAFDNGPWPRMRDMGPLISSAAVARTKGFVNRAIEQGARLVLGGNEPTGIPGGHYFEPTVFADVEPRMEVARTEVFGPVLSVLAYQNVDQAVKIANDVPLGLSASVWTDDLERGYAVAGRLDAGIVSVNEWTVGSGAIPLAPFKESGIGCDFGDEGALEYTQMRHVHISLDTDPARRGFHRGFPGLA